jgi:RHS repeat-associated protein
MEDARLATVDPSTGEIYYYLNDRLGTPQYLTNDNGMVIWEATYQPFGQADVNPSSKTENNFRFPGQYYDEETGLYYNYHRYYDPDTGRYLRADPIGLKGGINIYAYAQNNPVKLIDPFGLDAGDIIPGVRKAVLEGIKGAAYSIGEAGKFVGRNIKPSEYILRATIEGATVFGTASAISGNIPGTITFTMIGGSAKALKSAFYSNTPCNDSILHGIQSVIQAPPSVDPIIDKIIEESIHLYIRTNNFPKM